MNFRSLSSCCSAAGLLLALSLFLPLVVSMAYLETIPPYLDFDSASEGIFAHNLIYHGQYDYYFSSSTHSGDQYRVGFALQRLPYSLFLASLYRLVQLSPPDMEYFLKVISLFFALAGLTCFGLVVYRLSGSSFISVFATGVSLAHPSLFLMYRTGSSYFLFAFFLFWFAILLSVLHVESRRNIYLYSLGLLGSIVILNPYPMLVPIPLILIIFYYRTGLLPFLFKNKALYLALLLCFGTALLSHAALAHFFQIDRASYLTKLGEFSATRFRSGDFHFESLIEADFWRIRAEKIVNQHFLSIDDDLGDLSRSDANWVFNRTSWLHLAGLTPLFICGFFACFSRRFLYPQRAQFPPQLMSMLISVLLAFLLIFGTIFFPEGRYILPVVPLYALLAGMFLHLVYSKYRTLLSCAAFVFAVCYSLESYNLLVEHYSPAWAKEWKARAGLREIARELLPLAEDARVIVSLPAPLNYQARIYFYMITDFRLEALSRKDFSRELETIAVGRNVDAQQKVQKSRFFFCYFGTKLPRQVLPPGWHQSEILGVLLPFASESLTVVELIPSAETPL